MLETIVSWIVSVIGELLDAVVTGFLGMMNLDLASISASFPALTSGYRIFQAIGLGLVVLIAAVQIMKFFLGPLAESKDTPIRILLRSAIAAALIWFGGHILQIVVDLARIPYEIFVTLDAGAGTMTFSDMWENVGDLNLIDGVTIALGGAAALVLGLIMIVLIGWNLLKLMVEVCERFLMIGVLAYASPLVYPTLASQATSDVFKRFLGMFFGQCAIMTLSAWMLKLVLSGFAFTETDTNILFRLLLTLALCKIAQRTDTYMQQLGIGVATTGGNLVDEAIGIMSMFGGGRRGGFGHAGSSSSGGSSDAPLGAGPDGSLSRFGGVLGGISNAAQRARQQRNEGAPMSEVGRNFGKNFMVGAGVAKGVGTMKEAIKDKNLSGAQKTAKFGKGMAQAAGGLITGGALANNAKKFAEAQENARRQATKDATNGAANFNQRSGDRRYQNPDEPAYTDPNGRGYDNSENMSGASDEIRNEQRASMQTASQFFASQRAAHGVGAFELDENGFANLDDTAQRAGLRLDMSQDDPMLEGRDDVVGDFMSKNYQQAAQFDEMQEYMMNTAANGSPLAAEQALNNPYNNLEGNDELGDALLKKAYGEEAITGLSGEDLGGKFTNISAENVGDDGRVIHADYVDKDGNVTHYDLQNAEAMNAAPTASKLRQFGDGLMQRGPEPVESTGSGAMMYVQRGETMAPVTGPAPGPDIEPPVGGSGGTGESARRVTGNTDGYYDAPPPGSRDVPPAGGSGEQSYVPPRGSGRVADYSNAQPTSGPASRVTFDTVDIDRGNNHIRVNLNNVSIQSSGSARSVTANMDGYYDNAPPPGVRDAPPWRRNGGRRRNSVRPSSRPVDLSDAFNFGDDDDFI